MKRQAMKRQDMKRAYQASFTVEATMVLAVVFLSIASMISFAYARRKDVIANYKAATTAIDEADALNENEAEDHMRFMSVVVDFMKGDE